VGTLKSALKMSRLVSSAIVGSSTCTKSVEIAAASTAAPTTPRASASTARRTSSVGPRRGVEGLQELQSIGYINRRRESHRAGRRSRPSLLPTAVA
jgi:hypothetical protein